MKRVITPEELTAIYSLAAKYPDLRTISTDLEELSALRQRVVRGEAAVVAVRQSQVELEKALRRLSELKGITL
jgi:hypothetical protein